MSWNANQIYEYSKALINKAQMQTYDPSQFFYFWNAEQRAFQSDLIGKWQARSNGKGGVNTGLIENQVILTALSPFIIRATINVGSGFVARPSSHAYTLAVRVGDKDVTHISRNQIASLKRSVIDPPSIDDETYYYTEYATGLEVFPIDITAVDWEYVYDPNDVSWGYTLDGNNLPVYDAGTSVQPAWRPMEIIEITKRTMVALGVSFSSQDFQNFGRSTVVTGD